MTSSTTAQNSIMIELNLLRGGASALETYGDGDFAIEGLGLMTRVFDLFGRVLNNFKHNTLSLFKTIKRSELRAYIESHASSLKTLIRQPERIDLRTVQVPVPDGMIVPYATATAALLELYDKCRTREVLALMTDLLVRHCTLDPTQWHTLTSEIARASIAAEHISKEIVQTELRKIFAAQHHGREYPANRIMGATVQEISALTDMMLRFEPIYEETATIHVGVIKLDKTVDTIVSMARSGSDTVSRVYLQQLADLIRVAAVQFDMHGVIIAEMQRVEHNYTLGLARVVAAAQ